MATNSDQHRLSIEPTSSSLSHPLVAPCLPCLGPSLLLRKLSCDSTHGTRPRAMQSNARYRFIGVLPSDRRVGTGGHRVPGEEGASRGRCSMASPAVDAVVVESGGQGKHAPNMGEQAALPLARDAKSRE